MAEALDRINKLIALALNNPNAEEARSAAMAAVKKIRDEKIVLSEPVQQTHSPYATYRSPTDYNAWSKAYAQSRPTPEAERHEQWRQNEAHKTWGKWWTET